MGAHEVARPGIDAKEIPTLLEQAKRAAARRSQRPSTAHLLLAMLQSRAHVSRILRTRDVHEATLIGALDNNKDEPQSAIEVAVERSHKLAASFGEATPGAVHLLLALVREPRSAAYRALECAGASPKVVQEEAMLSVGRATPAAVSPEPATRKAVTRAMRSPAIFSASRIEQASVPKPSARQSKTIRSGKTSKVTALKNSTEFNAKSFPLLHRLGRNLTMLAKSGGLDPIVGRDSEIDRILDILAQRRGNSPLLVGPSGVGKTAIVEGVARKLCQGGDDTSGMMDCVLIEISVGALYSGTAMRGALAERIGQIHEEIERAQKNVILFFDEMHAAFGQQDMFGEFSQELKRLLGKGKLSCIGATTEPDYRRHIETDPGLARRFSKVVVNEPTAEQAQRIVRAVSAFYEEHHKIMYEREALDAAVELSRRFLPERQLPEKALALIDMAAARMKRRGGDAVTVKGVADVVAEQAGIPPDRVLLSDQAYLLELERKLEGRLVGQADALGVVADTLRKGSAGFLGNGPLATFLFLGPTGVGKTELAKSVHDIMFPGTEMTRLDMSEFSEPHSVAKLMGSPPGYIGHEEGGQLTEAVRKRPYQLVLFDEIEKANRDVVMSLLALLDEGRLTDSSGKTVDFTNTVIVMTSNLGVSSRNDIGFGDLNAEEISQGILANAKRSMAPELWNRIDEPIVFRSLDDNDLATIAEMRINKLKEMLLEQHGIELEVQPKVLDALVDGCRHEGNLGARPMQRVIARMIESRLAKTVLDLRRRGVDVLNISVREGKIEIEPS